METRRRDVGRVGPTEVRSVSMPVARMVTTRVAAEQTGWAYSLFEVEVGARGGEGPHIQHREDEYLYVVEGRFGFEVEGVATEAGPGSHLYVPKGVLHAYENEGGGTGRLLVVHTPGGPQERFVEAAGEPVTETVVHPSSRTSPEKFALLAAEHGIEICKATEQTERSF